MDTKICFKCEKEKELFDFYKHPKMADGYLGKCKECTKKDTHEVEVRIKSTPEGLEKYRKRHRDNYYIFDYKNKHKPTLERKKEINKCYYDKYPEKLLAVRASYKIKVDEGMQKHHWSYNKEHYKDIILLSDKDHYTAHRFMIYDQERMMFRNLNGELLDTKQIHENYIAEFISTKN